MGKKLLLLLFTSIFLVAATAPCLSANHVFGKTKVVNVAHRGAPFYAPELTLPSFDKALELGADFIELDIQLSQDGEIVVIHDTSLSRTTNVDGLVRFMTLAELKKLDAGSWFNEKYPEHGDDRFIGLQIPTLEEIFQLYGRSTNYMIEIKATDKYPGIEEKLLALLKKHELMDGENVIIQSFNRNVLKSIARKHPQLPLLQLISKPSRGKGAERELKDASSYAFAVGVKGKKLKEDYLKKAKANGLQVYVYTIDRKKDMKKLIEWGVDGIITNYPNRLTEVLGGG